jgi:hypothetical protein
MYGAERFQLDWQGLGFSETYISEPNLGNKFVIIPQFAVLTGPFCGRIIDIGFPALPDYPNSIGSSLHVRSTPHLLDYQNIASVRNIIPSPLGEDWRYWSLNFAQHWDSNLGVRRLLSLVNEVFSRV